MQKTVLATLATLIALANAADTTSQPVYYNMNHASFGIGSWNMANMNYYVCPGIIAGLATFFFIIFTFLFATCQLMAVQSPAYFTDKPVDWGKQEDVE